MATTTETVLIEFVSDASGLQSGEERLQALGKTDANTARVFKQTNTELQKRQALLNSLAQGNDKVTLSISKEQAQYNKVISTLKSLNGETKKVAQSLSAFSPKQLAAEFDLLGVSAEEYVEALKDAETQQISLRQQLKVFTQTLAEMKLAGEDNSEEYRNMARRAGEIKDAIADANAEIKDFASDTKGFDNLLGTAQAVAGGFAVAQGAAALFGDESKDLQETLLRVNAAMSVLQGLQSIQNALQKEGAISLTLITAQEKIHNAQLTIENGLHSKSIFIRGAATAAQWALNAAMAANPIGVVVAALTAAIALLVKYGNSARKAAADQALLNAALASANQQLDAEIEGLQNTNARMTADMEKQGARRSSILEQESNTEKRIYNKRLEERQRLEQALKETEGSTDEDVVARRKEVNDKITELDNELSKARTDIYIKDGEVRKQQSIEFLQDEISIANARLSKAVKNSQEEFDARRQVARAAAELEIQEAGQNGAKIKEIRSRLNRELRDIDIQAAKLRHDDRLAALNAELLDAQADSKAINERTSQEEVDIQKKVIQENARYELEQEGLTEKQKLEIRKRSLQEIAQLQKDFNKQSVQETLQDLISRNNAELQQINLNEEEKRDLRINNIIAAAEIELEENKGLSDKIKEITAKRDADILALRVQHIQESVDYEISLQDARSAAYRRSQEDIITNEKSTLQQRIAAIDQLTNYEIASIDKRIKALQEQHRIRGISDKDYELQYEKMLDDQVRAVEEAEKKKRNLQKETWQQNLATALEASSQLVATLDSFYSLQADQQNNAISEQRARVDELLETGAITEKEAEQRRKKIDQEERRYKQQQAEREKRIAVFEALLNVPRAILQGLAQGGPVLAAIYGGLAAFQAGVVAARPIPKFAKGKKDSYEGFGEVGEAGTELVEKDGRMYVVDKPQIVWLGKKDKVFNPSETAAMMANPQMASNKHLITPQATKQEFKIDYDKLGKSVAENIPQTGINIDENGFKEWVKEGDSFTIYLNNRRSY